MRLQTGWIAGAMLLASCAPIGASGTGDGDEGASGGKSDRGRLDGAVYAELRQMLEEQGVRPLSELPREEARPLDDPLVRLGQSLFFDKLLSGNEDISCATCHHPLAASGDAIPLSIGVGGRGLGPARALGAGRGFIPRNAPEIFNRGSALWTTMFWDMRVTETGGAFYTPVEERFPEGLDSVLAAQAMFPVTSPDEMRGEPGENEVADAVDEEGVWALLAARIRETEAYRPLFEAAYPDLAFEDVQMSHAANAIAAFEIAAFTFDEAPFDRFLRGADEALTPRQVRGARLFFGEARCSTCHSGPLFTDQEAHSICVPQLGPGKGESAPEDVGRYAQTSREEDRYAFRTPPLRNVTLTGPYMHDGAYARLEDAVHHHLDPIGGMLDYDAAQLPEALQSTVLEDDRLRDAMLSSLDPVLLEMPALDDGEVDDLLAFLEALTDPAARDLSHLVPEAVPSGLPIQD